VEDLQRSVAAPTEASVEAVVERAGGRVTVACGRPVLEAMEAVPWRTMPPLGPVPRGGPAEKVGISTGSRITHIDGVDVPTWEDMTGRLSGLSAGATVRVGWITPGMEKCEAAVVLGVDPVEGVAFPIELESRTVKAGPLRSFELGAKRTVVVSKQIFLTLKSLVRRDVAAKNLAGPIGIAHTFTVVIERGKFSMFIYLLALISINLGLFNLLPFPILDGGHLLFLAIEKIKGSPVDIRIQEWATNVAFFLILILAVFVTFNDVMRIFQ
jgi:regulator of sigma E protease